jgi:hypothetical protein
MNVNVFLKELIVRLMNETPAFFKAVRILLIITMFLGQIPNVLDFLYSLDLTGWIPDKASLLIGKIVSISSVVGVFISSLPTTIAVKKSEGLQD